MKALFENEIIPMIIAIIALAIFPFLGYKITQAITSACEDPYTGRNVKTEERKMLAVRR